MECENKNGIHPPVKPVRMKNKNPLIPTRVLAFFLYILSALPACSHHSVPAGAAGEYNGYVKYYARPAMGTVTLECSGFGKTLPSSSADASAAAFYTLLFRGVPGSSYELPMIADENGKKNDPVVTDLLNGGYNSFITENTLQSQSMTTKKADGAKGIMTVQHITINCDALRTYLEKNGVIRKFGV